jgi:hypothetical protein
MKTADITLHASHAYKNRKWANADRVWLLSRETYRVDHRADVSCGEARYHQVESAYRSSLHRYSYGMLAIVSSDYYVDMDPELVRILDEVTIEDVLAEQGLPSYVVEAFKAREKRLPEIKVVMARYFVKDWVTYRREEHAMREARLDRQEKASRDRDDRMERREKVVDLLNKVLATDDHPNPVFFHDAGDHRKVELDLEDAERLVEILRVVLPHTLKDK